MEGRDRISGLPVDILDNILGFLPIQEAVRTSVLSTVWRDVWHSLTRLNFGIEFITYIYEVSYDELFYGLDIVNRVLKQHNGPILKFDIYFIEEVVDWDEFDELFLFITQKGVEEIHFSLYGDGYMTYRLPSFIFSCRTLKRLHLSGVCIEPIHATSIFPNVTSLYFMDVFFDYQNLLLDAVDVPMLEDLSFNQCQSMFSFNIYAPKLRCLSIEECYHSDDEEDEEEDEYGEEEEEYEENKEEDKEESGFRFLPVNLDLRSICRLHLCCGSIGDFVVALTRMSPQLAALNVEYLKLSGFYFPEARNNSAFINLLRKCPKLCKLEICFQFETASIEDVSELLEGLDSVLQAQNMLHTLKLSSFQGSCSEKVFIKGLLASLPALEKIVIVGLKKFNSGKQSNITQKLLRSPRASAKVKVIYV